MKMKKFPLAITGTIAALLAITLFAGMAAAQTIITDTPPAQTPPSGPHPVRLAGNIKSIASSSLVLTTRQGDMTVNVSAQTWIVVQKNGVATQGSISDLVTGKAAVVAGMTTSDPKVVDARTIAQGATAAGEPNNNGARGKAAVAAVEHMAAGTITAINGSTITLKGEKVPQVVINTTANTVVLNNGFVSVSSLKVGDEVYVIGAPNKSATVPSATPTTPGTRRQPPESRTLTAWAIKVENGTSKLALGRVTAVNGNTLTVKTAAKRGNLTVNVDASTGYKNVTISTVDRSVTLAPAALSDIKVGSNLVIEGALSGDGKSLAAKAVIIVPGLPK